MTEIIDLSQDIYPGMPVFNGLPEVKMSIHATHEEWDEIPDPKTITPSVYKLELGEHTGTHVDALNHMGIQALKIRGGTGSPVRAVAVFEHGDG